MNTPILLDVTLPAGLLLPVTGDPGGLTGLTLLALDGSGTAELSPDGGATWADLTYPHTLAAGETLRLIRTDPDPTLSVLRATLPAEGGGGGGLGSAGVARLRASGPDVTQQATGGATGSYRVVIVRYYGFDPGEERTLSELRLQVPAGTTDLPTSVTVKLGSATLPLVGEASYVEADGARWLSLPLRAALSAGSPALTVTLGSALTLRTGAPQTPDLVTEAGATAQATASVLLGVRLVMTGPRTVPGRLSPDALPFVVSPTPAGQFPDPGLEVVLADPPYLRLLAGGQEFVLPFTAQS